MLSSLRTINGVFHAARLPRYAITYTLRCAIFTTRKGRSMRQITTAILICVSFVSLAHAGDFRDATWGMSKQEVIASETTVDLEKGFKSSELRGESTVFGIDIQITYRFQDGKLVSGEIEPGIIAPVDVFMERVRVNPIPS